MQFPSRKYVFGLSILALVAIVIAVVLKSGVLPEKTPVTRAWGGFSGAFFYPVTGVENASPETGRANLYTQVRSSPPFTYSAPDETPTSEYSSRYDFTLEEFLAMFGANTNKDISTGVPGETDPFDPYALIPSGFMESARSTEEEVRTPVQQSLYEYGNAAGSVVKKFEDANLDMADVLQQFIDMPESAAAQTALLQLAKELGDAGRSLEALPGVPAEAGSANRALAKSYLDMEQTLALVPRGTSEEERVGAMNTHNTAAEVYVKEYVALATLFSVFGVTFKAEDPGSVFTFTSLTL